MSYHHYTQKPPFTTDPVGLQTSVPERTFNADQETISPSEGALPLQAKLDQATRYGHHFSRIGVISGAPIQPKLTLGQPGDQYEEEADRVASQVVSMPEKQDESVQRSMAEEKEEEVQMKPLSGAISQIQRSALNPQEEKKEELQMKPLAGSIQRQAESQEEEEEAVQTKPQIQAASQAGGMETEGLESSLNTSKGGGSPLPEETRSFMEPRFGADFSGVRVHTNNTATEMNQSIQAQAFTHGKDIYFNSGQFDPGSSSGKTLLAHELTHVIQQTGRA